MKTYSLTDRGKERSKNQDCFFNYFHSRFSLLIICDGMGGHKAGDVASKLGAETVQQYIVRNKEREDYPQLMREAIAEANRVIFEESRHQEEYSNMGTTIVCALITGKTAYIAHVGDSRLYLFRENQLRQITEDHSLVADLMKRGLLLPEDAKHHPERSSLTRALGTDESVDPDFNELELSDGDMLLLNTDGLTNMVSDKEITEILGRNTSEKEECEQLIALANQHGGMDNITVTLYQVGE